MYSSLSDLNKLQSIEILLQLADDNNAGEFVITEPYNAPMVVVIEAIGDADTVIDSYLSGRYSVPLSEPIPAIVKQMSANIALCNLYDRRRELDAPEGIIKRRDRYLRMLSDIKTEKANIPELENSSAKIAPAAFLVDKSDADRIFSDDLLNMM
jgi:phage gp36-like protein